MNTGNILDQQFKQRINEFAIYHEHMINAFSKFLFADLQKEIENSNWELTIDPHDLDNIENFNLSIALLLKHRLYPEKTFRLHIKFEHLARTKFGITVDNPPCTVAYFADSAHEQENKNALRNILLCFEHFFPQEIPARLREF